MTRAQNCSLNLLVGTSSLNGSATITGETMNYERTLHQLASLTTTPDLYTSGCSNSTTGLSTSIGVTVQHKSNAPFVFALAAGNNTSNAVFILTTKTDLTGGTFVPLTNLPNASGLATADLNGDGNGDLLVVNNYAATSAFVSVVLGNGDGTFQNSVTYATGGSKSVAATIDDVNGDGKLDIIAVGDDQTISILTGKGDGTFNAAQNFGAPLPGSSTPTSTPIVNVITADVNGDGKKDLIGSNGLVLLGNGDGTFHAVTTPAFPFATAVSSGGPNLAAGDLNKDGKMDLVLNTGPVVSVWLGNGDGTFTRGASYSSIANSGFVTVTDLDGDGNPDIYTGLASNGFFSGDDTARTAAYVLMGRGDGTFVGAPAATKSYTGANLGDVNGDGYPDLIVPASGTVNGRTAVFTVQLGSAGGNFTPAATITAPASVTFSVSQSTSAVTESTTNLTPASYAVGDVNGDGKPDLVYVANYRDYAVYFVALGNGDGTFATATATGFPQLAPSSGYDISTTITGLRIGDFNRDGKADVLFIFNDTAGPFGNGLYLQGVGVLPGNGNGGFGAAILSTTYNSGIAPSTTVVPAPVSTADVNGDGLPDLVATNSSFTLINGTGVTTSTVQVYQGRTDGTFAAPTAAITTTSLGQTVVTDLNKDGKLDIAALTETSSSQAQLAIVLGKGDGTFNAAVTSNLAGGDAIRSAALAVADFDSDGNLDLALLDSNDYSGVFYGKGDGTFTSVPVKGNIVPKDLIAVAASGPGIATDLNKDGKPDILAGQTVLLNLYGSAPAVTQYATTTVLGTSASLIAPGVVVTLTANVTGAAGSTGIPGGTVTFSDGSTTLGTDTLDASGKATLTTTALTSAGSHSLTAVYGGSATFITSTSGAVGVTVTASAASTTTVLAALPASANAGTSITLTATVSATAGTATGTVNFLDGTANIGSGTLDGTGKAIFATSSLVAGSHSITAAYVGVTGFTGSMSSAVTVSVTAPANADFSLSLSPASATVTRGSSASSTLALSPVGGFKAATMLICGGAPANATCTISPSTLTPDGTNNATATVMVTTTSATAQMRRERIIEYASFSLAGLITLAGLLRRRRFAPALLLLLLGSWSALNLSGCGGKAAATNPNATPTGTYTVTVTGTAGSTTHAASFTLNVQ